LDAGDGLRRGRASKFESGVRKGEKNDLRVKTGRWSATYDFVKGRNQCRGTVARENNPHLSAERE